jgi:hypothetical protein
VEVVPLFRALRDDSAEVRVAAFEALTRLPLGRSDWERVESFITSVLARSESEAERVAVREACRFIPLPALRERFAVSGSDEVGHLDDGNARLSMKIDPSPAADSYRWSVRTWLETEPPGFIELSRDEWEAVRGRLPTEELHLRDVAALLEEEAERDRPRVHAVLVTLLFAHVLWEGRRHVSEFLGGNSVVEHVHEHQRQFRPDLLGLSSLYAEVAGSLFREFRSGSAYLGRHRDTYGSSADVFKFVEIEALGDSRSLCYQIGWTLSRGGLSGLVPGLAKQLASTDRDDRMAAAYLIADAAGYVADPYPPLFGGSAAPTRPSFVEPGPAAKAEEPAPRDPPRSAYGLLRCPDEVAVGQEFELTVGLAAEQEPGTAGLPLVRPASSVGPYLLTIDVDADGFDLAESEAWRNELRVTHDQPYPSLTHHLTPAPQPDDTRSTKIEATFSVDGQTIGLAVRYLRVQWADGAAGTTAATSAAGITMTVPSGATAPDITIRIRRWDSELGGRLRWSVESPHGIVIPETSESEIGDEPQKFAGDLVRQMTMREGQVGMMEYLRGTARDIAAKIPQPVIDSLRAVAQLAQSAPTCLILSEEPYIPWELALLDPPLDPDELPFLATQAVVGRWILSDRPPPSPTPPTALEVRDVAVVSGVYDKVPGWARLLEAEGESQDLQERFGAVGVDASMKPVLDCLRGTPPADVLHFAVHGKYDPNGIQRGLALVDRQMLDPMQIKAFSLQRAPFVFLNACQAGAGEEILGDYAGLAAAFLAVGASGVIAPLWSINDKLARAIALDFYDEVLHSGTGPAHVLARKRRAIESSGTTSATALAYQFFGHPLIRLATVAAPAEGDGQEGRHGG